MVSQRFSSLKVPLSARWMGVLPLSLFVFRLIDYARAGTPEHILWNCHIANISLALGLFSGFAPLIRVPVLWLLFGAAPWTYDMVATGQLSPVAVFSHIGGFTVALWTVSRAGMTGTTWLPALTCHLIWQQMTRFISPPQANINIAHAPYPGFDGCFTGYWQYWFIQAVLAAVALRLVEWGAIRLFRSPRPWQLLDADALPGEKVSRETTEQTE
jgi:hypothetical protein